MKNLDIRNVLKICTFNLFVTKKSIIGWSVAVFGIMSLYMILFSSVQDIAVTKMEAMPKELLQFVGMEELSDMSNYTTYYGMIYGLIVVAVSIFAATFSAGLITKEEKSKSIEFLNSLAVSRNEIFLAKYLTSIIATGIVLSCAVISAIICGFISGGETFDLVDIFTSAKITSFTALLFGAVGYKVAGINASYGSGTIAAVVVLTSYMLGYLGQLLGENGELLLYLSPFITLSVENTIELSDKTLATLTVYVFIYLATLIAGCIGYNKRDLKI